MPQNFEQYQVIYKIQEKENKAIISGNWKFIVIEENKSSFKKESIATKALNKSDYEGACTKNFLVVFCVKDIYKEEFKSLIDSKLKANPFDKKNPQIFINDILSDEFKIESIEPVVDFYSILKHPLPEIKNIKQKEEAISFIEKEIRDAQKELCSFDEKDEISKILVSVSTKLENDQEVSLKELNSYIRQINNVKYKIWLIKLKNEQLELEKLQSVFEGMDEKKAIMPLKESAIALLAKYNTDPDSKNLAKLANCTTEVIERCEFYKNKLQQAISNLEQDMAEMTEQLDHLHASLPPEASREFFKEGDLIERIKLFLENLRPENPEKTLSILEKEASQIKEIYTTYCVELEKVITPGSGVDNLKLRQVQKGVFKFFNTNNSIFDQIKQHGEKIEHGRWGADKKAKILKNIHAQIIQISDASTELNQAPTEHKTNKILDDLKSLSQKINDSKETLSRYRGISLFRSIATLWGGGKIKSMDFITELEVGLKELKDNTDSHLKVTRQSL